MANLFLINTLETQRRLRERATRDRRVRRRPRR
jgi:hypothetical protein